jgi:hypothetical protein
MGIDTEIRDHLRDEWASDAFIPKEDALKRLGKGSVRIEDVLTRVLHTLGPNYDHMCTTLQYYDMFVRVVKHAFERENVRVYVIIADDETVKTTRKSATQASRAKQKNKQTPDAAPYPKHVVITDDGIFDPVAKTTEMIDLRRMAKSRWLRPALWQYMHKLMETDSLLDDDHMIIFEYSTDGPKILPSMVAWPDDVPVPNSLKHNHTESDPSCAFWTRVFNTRAASIMSTDTDIIPVIMKTVSDLGDKVNPEIMWYNNTDTVVDMKLLTQDACRSTGLTVDQFVLYTIMCKTDYVDKQLYAKGFGCLPILYVARKMKSRLGAMIASFQNREDGRVTDAAIEAFELFIRALYAEGRSRSNSDDMKRLIPGAGVKHSLTQTEVMASSSSSKRQKTDNGKKEKEFMPEEMDVIAKTYVNLKKYKLPTRDDMTEALDNIGWNFNFWKAQSTFVVQ